MFILNDIRPKSGDKFFITKKNGGYSPCISIAGSPADLDALPNCVGYAVGQFNKICGRTDFPYLGNTNAENQLDLARSQGLAVSRLPVLGGAMVWAKGRTWYSKDGAGHIAICTGLNPDGSCVTSDSAYRSSVYYTKLRSGENYSQPAEYTYLGCVVNPCAMYSDKVPAQTLKRGSKGEGVKWLQAALQGAGHYCVIDGAFGPETEKALISFQVRWGLVPDGACGRITKGMILKLYKG